MILDYLVPIESQKYDFYNCVSMLLLPSYRNTVSLTSALQKSEWHWSQRQSDKETYIISTKPLLLLDANVAQLCPTLCDPMDYTVHGILQARILEWVAIPFSRGTSQPRDQTQVSCTAGRFFTS